MNVKYCGNIIIRWGGGGDVRVFRGLLVRMNERPHIHLTK